MEETESNTLELIKSAESELSKIRAPVEPLFEEESDAYYGKQNKGNPHVKSVKNYCFKVVETELAVLLDSMPSTQVLAKKEESQEKADVLEKSIRYVHKSQNLPMHLTTVYRQALSGGPGFLYPYYDPDADMGEGEIKYKTIPWYDVWLDDCPLIDDGSKVRIRMPINRKKLMRLFPEYKDKIKEARQMGKGSSVSIDADAYEDRDMGRSGKSSGHPKRHISKDTLAYNELWLKSFDLEPIPPEETAADLKKEYEDVQAGEPPNVNKWEAHKEHAAAHLAQRGELLAAIGLPPDMPHADALAAAEQLLQSNPKASKQFSAILVRVKMLDNHIEEHGVLLESNPNGQRPKYKDGWRLIRYVNETVLYDGPNPEQTGMVQLVPFFCYKDDTPYGFSEIRHILNIQNDINEMDYKEKRSLKKNANSGWVTDYESGVSSQNLTDEEGIVIQKPQGTEVRRLEPGIVSPQIANRIKYDVESVTVITGMGEIMGGQMPAPNASGTTVRRLQTQATGRVRLKEQSLQYYSMSRLDQLTGKLVINNWSKKKIMRLRSNDGEMESFVYDPVSMEDLEWMVETSPSSMAGIDKDALNHFYLTLLQGGQITLQEFLSVAEMPKKELIQKSLTQRDQAAAQMQQLQQSMEGMRNENIMLKLSVNPQMLNNEERAIAEEIGRQQLIERQTNGYGAVNNDQAPNQGIVNE